MFIKIKDAPFTDAEKKEILSMGFTSAEWGHPSIVLGDPVAHFKKMNNLGRDLVKEGGAGFTKYERNEQPQPFGESKMDDYV